jgi:anionic cell wall polymer biosynthesis LytR-Cps2A-Psr (LCP) family protein
VTAVIVLLVVLAALVGALVAFQGFRNDVRASNRRVPAATKRSLAPSRDVLSTPQLVLSVFDRASLLARTDPDRRLISFLSIPGSAYLRAPGGTTVAGVLGNAGAAGLVRFLRGALDLQVTHIALLRQHDIASLVDALGGIRIQDASSFSGSGPPGRPAVLDGAEADRYIARAGPPGDRTRRERERAVLGAIITGLASGASLSTLPRLARTFSATVATDLSPRETLALALVRLHSKLSIQCGLPEGSTLKRPQSKHILRQFEAVRPPPRKQARIFPSNGCRATALSLRAPAAVIFIGKPALALFPFVPELAAVAIAFDVMFLLVLLGVPRALVGMVRSGRAGRRAPRPGIDVDNAEPESLSSTSVGEVLADRVATYTAQSAEPRAAPANVVRANSEIEATPEGLADEMHPSIRGDKAAEEEAQVEPRVGREPLFPTAPPPVPRRNNLFRRKPSFRRAEELRATIGQRLRYGGFRQHPDAAWVLVGTAAAIFIGYLISQL